MLTFQHEKFSGISHPLRMNLPRHDKTCVHKCKRLLTAALNQLSKNFGHNTVFQKLVFVTHHTVIEEPVAVLTLIS